MRVLIISSPENLARLEEIRGDLARLADPRQTSAAQPAEIARRTPAVAILSHSIHGNEPAGFEAAMQTAYQLLASDEPATLEILRNVITIINPSQNPDGHERFAAWNNSVAVPSDEPGALEQFGTVERAGPLQSLPVRHEPGFRRAVAAGDPRRWPD
jgi:hypothetical protein